MRSLETPRGEGRVQVLIKAVFLEEPAEGWHRAGKEKPSEAVLSGKPRRGRGPQAGPGE